jgi:hypothetical protein
VTILRTILAALPSLIAGVALVDLLYPARRPSDWLLKLFLGFGLGLGVTSCLDFYWILLYSPENSGYRWLEWVLAMGLVGAGAVRWRRSKLVVLRRANFHRPSSWLIYALAGMLVAGGALALYSFWAGAVLRPFGNFDAYAIWNLRARSLLLVNPETWPQAFSPLLSWKAHADYPLLWPITLLRAWQELGSQWPQAGQTQAIGFGLACAGLMFTGLLRLRGLGQATLGTLLLVSMPWFITYNVFQQADGPLAYFYLIVILLLYKYEQNNNPAILTLAGLGAGLAGWTKNDGLVFILAVWIYLLVRFGRRPFGKSLGGLVPFGVGVLLPLVTILIFKVRLAPEGDLLGTQTLAQMLAKMIDPTRWGLILAAIGAALPTLGGWSWPAAAAIPLYGLLAGKAPGGRGFWLWLALGLTLAGYVAVYLVTPHDLAWHLQYSLARLLFHLLPASLFLLLALAKNPGQILVGTDQSF